MVRLLMFSKTLSLKRILKHFRMDSIQTMSSRILKMRQALFDHLTSLNTPGTWNHITEQIGMFSYTGLNGKSLNFKCFENITQIF